MKAAVWLALAVSPALGQIGGGEIAPFAVYTEFQHAPPPAVLNALKLETNSIMSGAGWPLRWRLLSTHPDNEVFTQLVVVTFKGSCDVARVAPERLRARTLGETSVSRGDVMPFSSVDCDAVRAFLSHSLFKMWPAERAPLFGRAIGRVLAHELYHVATRTRHHGSEGVAEAAFTEQELLADDFSFSADDQRILTTLYLTQRPTDAAISRAAGRAAFAKGGCLSCHGEKARGTALAPAIPSSSHTLTPGRLAAKLGATASEMFKRARSLKISWSVDRADLQNLVNYLASPTE